jgi:exodeoxyribonuclease VIII
MHCNNWTISSPQTHQMEKTRFRSGGMALHDNVLLAESFDRAGIPCPWKFWNNRDVRTIVELGKAVGYTPRYEIPFVGEPHKAISDAHHQVKYVSAIWQRLTSN